MIKTKYYSDLTKKFYDVSEDAEKEEKALEEKNAIELKKKEERVAAAKEIENAYKHYLELRADFIKKYGSYHLTLTEKDLPKSTSVFDLFDWFI